MLGRLLLPHYGGAFYVWATTLMFFQGALLVGYFYAHWLGPRLGSLHLLVLLLPLPLLPFAPRGTLGDGTASLTWTLALTCGLPFVLLSSTSVLAQSWLANSRLPERANPYPLYSASNVGSLAALLGYVLLCEPYLGMRHQGWLWAGGYAAYLVSGVGAYASTRAAPAPLGGAGLRPPARSLLTWVLLAAGPSALSMAVTNLVIVEIGNTPLLWVLPLAAYLTTFILAFRDRETPRPLVRLLPHLSLGALGLYALSGGVAQGWFVGLLHIVLLFAICWSAHGALYQARPAAEQLTTYYLALSLGGWAGGAFVALLAPRIFDQLYEYVAAIALTAITVTIVRRSWRAPRNELAVLGVTALALIGLWARAGFAEAGSERLIGSRRSPYGIYRVIESEDAGGRRVRRLESGRTIHGRQAIDAASVLDPTPQGYYHANGPLGDALRELPRPWRIGVIGLGVGAIAGHLDASDSVVFYEIDRAVTELAREHFSYLGTPAHVEVRMGDARRLLESEAELGAPRHQLLVVDAFTGDAIPVHLLTLEALRLYLERVEPGGTVLLHISSRFVPLQRVLFSGATRLGVPLSRRNQLDGLVPGQDSSQYAALRSLSAPGWEPVKRGIGSPWTDDHASLLPLWMERWW